MRECVWFNRFEVEVEGGVVHFVGHSDGIQLNSRATQETAVKFAYDILNSVEAAEMAELDGAEVLPFCRAHV